MNGSGVFSALSVTGDAKPAAQLGKSKNARLWLAIAATALLGISGALIWRSHQTNELPASSTSAEQVFIPTTVTALGRLEPKGEIVNLTAPTSTQESRIETLRVKEGDRVAAGDLIAVLDNRDRLQATLLSAQAQVRIAQAKLAQTKAGAKSGELQAQRAEIARLEAAQIGDIATQQATIARLQAERNTAQAEFQRYQSLYERGAVSASERDANQLTYTSAQRRVQEAEAALNRIQSTRQQQLEQAHATLNRIGEVRPVDVALAEAEVRSAVASVAEAQANLEQAEVRSPASGQILKIHTRPGETIASEGIVTLGQTEQMMVVAEVYQDDIAKIEPTQPVEIISSISSESFIGTVESIGLQVQQQQVVNEDPAANIDAKVVEVTISLDPDASKQLASLTNLQVTATINVE
ncbi:MAG: HlyD family efflux transporter periplasmic adaptor subunit [Phormidesmis sp.]